MVGLNIPVTVEVLPESLRKISRDINRSVSSLSPELNVDTTKLKGAIQAGLGGQLLEIQGLSAKAKTIIGQQLNQALIGRVEKLTVTADAKRRVAADIENAVQNIEIFADIDNLKKSFDNVEQGAKNIRESLNDAATEYAIKIQKANQTRVDFETERDRPTRLGNLPQQGGMANVAQNIRELENLDRLDAEAAEAAKELEEASRVLTFMEDSFNAVSGVANDLKAKIERVGDTTIEGEQEKLAGALNKQFSLIERESKQFQDSIQAKLRSSRALRSLTGEEARAARVAADGVRDAETLKAARSKLAAILVKQREERNRSKIVELIDEEGRLKRILAKEVASAKRRTQSKNADERARADKLVANIGKNIAKREQARIKAINDSIKAFTQQTGEVLKGAQAQKQLFAKIRKTLSAPTVAGGAGLGGAGDVGGIRGTGSLQKFAQDLDPQQLRAFESALRRINIEVDDFGRSIDSANKEGGKFSDISRKNAAAGKSFSKSLKDVAGTAFLAFKRLLLYTVISQVIFGVTRKIKEAAGALVDFELQARRLIFFEQSTLNASRGADKLVKSTRTIQQTFDETITLANKLGISIADATTALVTSARVGQRVGGAFAETVSALVRLEAGALSAEAAVTSLNAIQKQFFSNLDRFSNSTAGVAAGLSDIQRGANLAEQSILGIGATLANTAAQSSLNIQQLSDVVGRVGAAFSSLQGTDPITLIRLVGEAASISGANVGRLSTGLKQSATLVIQNAEKIKSLTGVEVFSGGQVRGLDAIIEVLEKANEAAGTFKQRAILATLFDRRSLDVGAALASAVGSIADKTKDLSDVEKRANFVRAQTIQFLEAQEDISKSLDSAFNRLDNTFTSLAASEDLTRLLTAFVDIARLTVLEVQKIFTGLNSLGTAFIEGESILSLFANALGFVRDNFTIFVDLFKETAFGKFITSQGKVIDNLKKIGIAFQNAASIGKTFSGIIGEIGNALFNNFVFLISQLFNIVGPAFREVGAIAGEGFTTGLTSSLKAGLGTAFRAVFGGVDDSTINAAKSDGERVADAIVEGRNNRLKGTPIEELGKAFTGSSDTKKAQDDARRLADIQLKGEEAANAVRQRAADLIQQNFASTLERVPIERKIFNDLKLQEETLGKLADANLTVAERAKLTAEFMLRAEGIAANQLVSSTRLQALTKERLNLEREVAIAIEQQAQELERARSLSTSLTNLIGGQEGIELQIRFDEAILNQEINNLEQRVRNLAKIAADTAASTSDEDSAAATEEAFAAVTKAQTELNNSRRKLIEEEEAGAIKRFDLATKSTQNQINAWKSASDSIASAFGKAISLQKGLADIFNRAGELASQRLKNTASNINAFLERTGASIENRLAAARSQAAAQLAQLERNGRRQIAAVERVGQGETFGTEQQVEADTNRLIDALISASEAAEQEVANKRREVLNEEAAVRGQIAGQLRSEFELRVNATRNEIAVRQRLIGQEIAILQEKVQAERRFAELREDQQRSFGRLLIDSPQKFADTLKDFRFAQGFFRDITDVNLEGLQQIQGRLAKVLGAFGPEGVQTLARGLENAIKFGLPEVIAGVGNAQALSIVERLQLQTPAALNEAIQEQAERARQQSEEQKRIKLLQEQQRELVKKDAKLQNAQLRLAEFDGRQAKIQRNKIIELLKKELDIFKLANENLILLRTEAERRVAGAEGTTGINFGAITNSVTTGMDTSLEAFRMLFTTPLTVETPTVTPERDKLNKEIKKLTDATDTTTTPPPPPRPITPRELVPTPFDEDTSIPKFNPADIDREAREREAAAKAAAEAAAELRRGLPEPQRGSDTSTDAEIRKLIEFQKAGNKLTFEQIAILEKALRDRGGPITEIDPGAIRTPESDLKEEITEALKREGLEPRVRPELPALPPRETFDPTTGAGLFQDELDDLFDGITQSELDRLQEPPPIPEDRPAPSERFDPSTGRGLFSDELDALAEGLGRQTDAAVAAAAAAEKAAQAAAVAAEAAKAAAEARAAQDALDEKFINESPLFKEEEVLAVTEKIARSISESVNDAIINGGLDLSEKITETIKGNKIEVEIPEQIVKVQLDGQITTELNADKFFADLTAALETTGLTQTQIESIRRRIVELTKNQRDAGARVTNDASLGD